ncbi:Proliferating cell nuclear antigen [Grifola frondosa]|uniref:Proliferating cell nuclear antigen n=1 Tax=Grifola frondosa TaxID=5627 RepID=A0A1C7MAN1_GRIFR|nr:Proliferating cell nuclear antigen [Grifola frondosa]
MNGDEDEEDEGEFKPKDADDEEQDEEGEEEVPSKKRKKAPVKNGKASKKAKKSDDELPDGVRIEMNQAVTLTFSLKYLVNFSKSSSLSNKVQLMMSNDVPLLVAYNFGQGHIRYYLAPKIGDD